MEKFITYNDLIIVTFTLIIFLILQRIIIYLQDKNINLLKKIIELTESINNNSSNNKI